MTLRGAGGRSRTRSRQPTGLCFLWIAGLMLCARCASAAYQVPFQPQPRVWTVVGSSNSSLPNNQPGVGMQTYFDAIADMAFCALDRSVYWLEPWNYRALWKMQAYPPYVVSLVADLNDVAISMPWSIVLDSQCTAYIGVSKEDGGIVRVSRDGTKFMLAVLPAKDFDGIALDEKRKNLWVSCGTSGGYTNPGLYKISTENGTYAKIFDGNNFGDMAIAIDVARDRLWMMHWSFGLKYVDLGTETLSASLCMAETSTYEDPATYGYVDGPCASARIMDMIFARYVPGPDLILFTDYGLNALRAILLKTMEVVTVAGCGVTKLDAAPSQQDGVGTSACFFAFVQSVTLDTFTGDLYIGADLGSWSMGAIKRVGTGHAMWPNANLLLDGGSFQLTGGASFTLRP